MTSKETSSPSQAYNKAFQVLFVIVLVGAVSGYFVGLRQTSLDAERAGRRAGRRGHSVC